MTHRAAPTSLDKLTKFKFERIINEDPVTHSLILLGTFPPMSGQDDPKERVRAIVRVEKTALSPGHAESFFSGENALLTKIELEESTDIVCVICLDFNNNHYWTVY